MYQREKKLHSLGVAKQKTVESSEGAASLLIGNWPEPLRLALNVSTGKKASLPESNKRVPVQINTQSGCLTPCLRIALLADGERPVAERVHEPLSQVSSA